MNVTFVKIWEESGKWCELTNITYEYVHTEQHQPNTACGGRVWVVLEILGESVGTEYKVLRAQVTEGSSQLSPSGSYTKLHGGLSICSQQREGDLCHLQTTGKPPSIAVVISYMCKYGRALIVDCQKAPYPKRWLTKIFAVCKLKCSH